MEKIRRLCAKENERWLVLILCCIMCGGCCGIGNAKGVFTSPLCDGLEISRGAFGLSSTISSAVSCFTNFMVPVMIAKLGCRKTMIIGLSLNIVSYTFLCTAKGIIGFYISSIIGGCAGCMYGLTVLMMIINQWFTTNHGLASGMVSSFTGVSGAIFSPIFASCIARYGWQKAEAICCIISTVASIPLLLYRKNLIPVKQKEIQPDEKTETSVTDRPLDLGISKNKKLDIIIVCAGYCLCITAVSCVAYISGFAELHGFNAQIGATMISMIMIGNIISKLSYGILADRIGAIRTAVVMYSINAVAATLLLNAKTELVLLGASLLYGSQYSISGLGGSLIAKQMFGTDGYGTYYPILSTSSTIASALASPIIGSVYDHTGSYDPSIKFVIIADIVSLCIMLLLSMKLQKKTSSTAEETA